MLTIVVILVKGEDFAPVKKFICYASSFRV